MIDKFKEHAKNLLNICDSITEDTVLTTGKFMNILWKHFHHITLSRIDLFKLKNELSEINFNTNIECQGKAFAINYIEIIHLLFYF